MVSTNHSLVRLFMIYYKLELVSQQNSNLNIVFPPVTLTSGGIFNTVRYTIHMMRINLWRREVDPHLDLTGQYAKDMTRYTELRHKAHQFGRVDEVARYDYIIEVMQRTLTELIDRNKE